MPAKIDILEHLGETALLLPQLINQALTANDRDLLKYKFGPNDTRLYFSNDHMGNFLECVKSRKEPSRIIAFLDDGLL